jgi:hypothetical protein
MLPGDLIFDDWNGDGIIDGNDNRPFSLNNANNPLITYGLTLGSEYKGFDLNVVVQGTAMRWNRNAQGMWHTQPLWWGRGGLDIFLDRWHREDPYDPNSAWIPGHYPSMWVDNGRTFLVAAGTATGGGGAGDSSFWMEDCSYVRIKSLELGYTIPAKILTKAGLSAARLFFNSYNLLTISDITYTDPEFPGSENNDAQQYPYPNSRSFNFGVQITF